MAALVAVAAEGLVEAGVDMADLEVVVEGLVEAGVDLVEDMAVAGVADLVEAMPVAGVADLAEAVMGRTSANRRSSLQ